MKGAPKRLGKASGELAEEAWGRVAKRVAPENPQGEGRNPALGREGSRLRHEQQVAPGKVDCACSARWPRDAAAGERPWHPIDGSEGRRDQLKRGKARVPRRPKVSAQPEELNRFPAQAVSEIERNHPVTFMEELVYQRRAVQSTTDQHADRSTWMAHAG